MFISRNCAYWSPKTGGSSLRVVGKSQLLRKRFLEPFNRCVRLSLVTWQSPLKEGKVYFGPQLKGSPILAEKGRWQARPWPCWACSQEEETDVFLDLASLFLLCSIGSQPTDLCCSQSDWVFQFHFNIPEVCLQAILNPVRVTVATIRLCHPLYPTAWRSQHRLLGASLLTLHRPSREGNTNIRKEPF